MKKLLLPLFLLVAASSFGQGGILKKASGILNKAKGGSLTNEEIISGLKEALSVGATNSATKLSAVDGFLPMQPLKC